MLSASIAERTGRQAPVLSRVLEQRQEQCHVANWMNSIDREQLLSRRSLLLGAAALATVGVGGSMIWSAMQAPQAEEAEVKKQAKRPPRRPGNVASDELMKPGPLPELVIGKADAPITIVEYASMTCGHCASFHNTVLPQLKEKYIDTGQVRLVFREFPLDERAAAASMVARCAGGDKTLPLISVLLAKQDDWAFGKEDFLPKLFKYAQQAGFSKQSFETCRQDEKLLQNVIAVRDRAHQSFGVSSTPTFFVNGKRLDGVALADFDKALAPLIKR
jgi:protein-disulfide isomerase